MTDVFRTPEDRFATIPDFPFQPRYRDWQGMRLAHIDEGDGPPVLLLHGEPTWSFLWRKVIPPMLEAGFRCIAPDLPGFGRSDKPTEQSWYSFDNHTAAVVSLFDDLDLNDVSLVVHDWGGPIGLRLATLERPDRVSRIAVMDTGVFTGEKQMSPAWLRFRDYVAQHPDLPIWRLIRGGCKNQPSEDVLNAYEAPFPNEASKAGARAFPMLLPLTPDAPGSAAGRATVKALLRDKRPALILWADSDQVLPLDPVGRQIHRLFQGAGELKVIPDASHFVQEDQGDLVGHLITGWLRGG
jgi:haloalkane dehalogenase